jgi:hypothetical protein
MSRMNKLSNYRTTWFNNGNQGGVRYAYTDIVTWKDGKVTLNSDGWETVTTKRKMNQASNQFGLGFDVYQDNWTWFVNLPNGGVVKYYDGITFEMFGG